MRRDREKHSMRRSWMLTLMLCVLLHSSPAPVACAFSFSPQSKVDQVTPSTRPSLWGSYWFRRKTPLVRRESKNAAIGNEDAQSSLSPSSPTTPSTKLASKRKMLGFAVPALGIYLSSPLLSNIDNAFVGRTVGTYGLAALSPATVCTDQMLYLFSFLSRTTTGLVSRAYGAETDSDEGDTAAAREAGSAPLTVSLLCGACLSVVYVLFTPQMLSAFRVDPSLRSPAASYIYWRGGVAAAALAQSVALSILMATRDAVTPLRIIALSAVFNVAGDALLCVWPFQWGCAGAAAATSGATLLSSAFMIRALKRKQLLPRIRMPTKSELKGLMEFTGPLLAITLTRLAGFIEMQRTAMKLGMQQLAAYQLSINLVMFFLLFGEPLSQLSQTKLPALVDKEDGDSVLATLKSVLTLAVLTALGVGGVAYGSIVLGSGLFSSDEVVQALARDAAPSVFMAVAQAIFAVAVDGAMLASRDFGFMLVVGLSSYAMQIHLLKQCTTLSFIYGTFALRLGLYAAASLGRTVLGYGALGRAIRSRHGSAKGEPT